MQGNILALDAAGASGILSGADGNRYRFSLSEWKSASRPRIGEPVDFLVQEGSAVEVYSLKSSRTYGEWLSFLFTLSGRVSRRDYWVRYIFPLVGLWFLGAILDNLFFPTQSYGQRSQPVFVSIVSLFFLWPCIAVSIRRLHDRNMSGFWLLAGSVLLLPVAAYWYLNKPAAEGDPVATSAQYDWSAQIFVYMLVWVSASLWLFVNANLLALRGAAQGNRFGPNPDSNATAGAGVSISSAMAWCFALVGAVVVFWGTQQSLTRLNDPAQKLVLRVQRNTAICTVEHPLFITFENNSDQSLMYVSWSLEVFREGYSSSVVKDPPNYASDKIVGPRSSDSLCYQLPSLTEEANGQPLTFKVVGVNARFE